MRKLIVAIILLLLPLTLFAQKAAQEKMEQLTVIPTSSIASNQEIVFSESDVLEKPFIRIRRPLMPEIEKKINSYFIKPGDIFSKDFSRNTNIVCDVGMEQDKLAFYMDLIAGETQTYLSNKEEKPLIDVSLMKLAEFDFKAGRLVINNDQVIDWQNIVEKQKNTKGSFVGIATISNSYLQSALYNFFIYPHYQGGYLRFDIDGNKGEVDILENLTNNNGFLEIYNTQGSHLVKIQPNEIFSKVKEFVASNQSVKLLGIDLVIYKGEASYRVRVREPIAWLWVFEGEINSDYYIGAGEDNIISIDEGRPWYSIFGLVHGFRPQEVAGKMIMVQQENASSSNATSVAPQN